ncbi:MAG: YkvA family protein [Phycisphaerales bacterium]
MLKYVLGIIGGWFAAWRGKRCAKDTERTRRLVDAAEAKAGLRKGRLRAMFGSLSALLRLVRAWVNGSYRVVPWKSLVMAVGGLIYFVLPLDIFPDFIPLLGFFDDAAVIAYIVRTIQQDLDAFTAWERENKTQTIDHTGPVVEGKQTPGLQQG